MTQYIDQLIQAVNESDTPKKTLSTILVTGFPNATPRPTLSSVAAPAASPMGIVQPEPGVVSQVEETSLLGLPLGFAKNVAGGLGMLTQGLTSLVGAAGHDIYKGLASAVIPGEQSVEESPTALLGMVGAMTGYDEWMPTEISQGKVGSFLGIPTKLGLPEGEDAPSMIVEDMKARWGPLLRGDIGEFAEQLYEKPVSFGLDALMFAGAPGAAGRGAGYLAKGAPVFGLKLARPLTKSTGLTNVANYLNKFRVPAGAALGNRDVLYPLGGDIPVGVTPGGVYIPSIAEVSAIRNASVARRASINPLVRLAQRGIHNLASTKTVPGLGIPVKDALGMFDDPAKMEYLFTKLRTDLDQGKGMDYGSQLAVAKLLSDAASTHGFTTSPRLYQPWARRTNQTMLMRMRQAAHGAALIDLRELTNEFNRKYLDKIESAEDVTFLEDMLNASGDHRTPLDSPLWGYRNFQAEADMAAMGSDPYQLGYDAMLDPSGRGTIGRRGVDIPDSANESNLYEGMENIPRPEDRPQMLRETPSGGLYPNPAITDIRGGAGLTRGTRIEFEGIEGVAKFLHADEEGIWVDFGNGPELAPNRPWREAARLESGETAAQMQARLLGEEFAPKVEAPKPKRARKTQQPAPEPGDEIYANHEQVAAIEAAHPDQTFLSTDISTGLGAERVVAPEGDAFVTMYDDANIYRYSRNTGELLETTAKKNRGAAMAGWNIEDVVGEKKIQNLEELGVDFDDMPNTVIDWLDEGGKVEEWIKSWLNSGDEDARAFIDHWSRNVDGFRTLKAPTAVGWRKIVFGMGDEDFVLVPMKKEDKFQFFKRIKDTLPEPEATPEISLKDRFLAGAPARGGKKPKPDVQARSRLTEAEEQGAQTDFVENLARATEKAETQATPTPAPAALDLTNPKVATAVREGNLKIKKLRDEGVEVDKPLMQTIIDAELQKLGIDRRGNPAGAAPMELAKATPEPAKPSVAPAILREGEGKPVWNGVELKPGSMHTLKIEGWKRNQKVRIDAETTMPGGVMKGVKEQVGIRYTRKTARGGESSNFAPYDFIESIDGKPRVAAPAKAAPIPEAPQVAKATVKAKPKVEPPAPPKAPAAEVFAGIPVGEDAAPWTLTDPLLPDYGTYTPADIAKQTFPTDTPYIVLDQDGFVQAMFATRDEVLDYANVYGGEVVLPGAVDLPPIKVPPPPVYMTPPPVAPFNSIFDKLPPERMPRPQNLDVKPVGVRIFQTLIGDKPGKNPEYRGAEMFATPWYAPSDKYRPARFLHFIDNMRKVDDYVTLDGQKTNARVIGISNTLNDGGDINPRYGAWRAYNAWFETPDGDVFEIQYLTPDMAAPLEAVSHVWKRIDSVETEITAHEASLKQIRQSIGDKKPTKAQLKEMADHASEMEKLGDEVLALKRQGAGFNEAIVRELANPDGYDKRYKAFDQIRANWYNQQTVPEFTHLPYSTLSAAQQIDRSYIMPKVKKYDMWMFDLRKKMEDIVAAIPKDVETDVIAMLKGMVVKNLDDMVKNSRHREDLAKFENGPFADGIEAWVDAAIPGNARTSDPIAYVLNKLDEFTSKAVEDGRGTNKDVAFWQDMFNYRWQDIDAEFPMGTLPGYYPHIRMSTKGPGGYLGRMHNLSALNSGEPEALRRATGALARNRNFTSTRLLDSFEDYRGMKQFKNATADEIHLQRLNDAKQVIEDVYSLRATQLTRHRQVLDFIEEIKALSRPVTPMEMEMWKNGRGIAGYKLMNFDQVKTHVSIRGKMFDRLYKKMTEQPDFGAGGGDYDKLASEALNEILDEAHEAAIAALRDGTGTDGALYAVPEHLVSEFNRNVGRAMGWKVRFGVDAPMNVWKSLVLSFSPRWIVNNTVGNTIFTLIRNPGALQEMVRLRDKKYWNTMKYVFEGVFPEGVERGLFAKSTQRVTNYGFAENVAPRTADLYRTMRGQPSAMAMSVPEVLKPGMSIYQRMARRTGKMAEGMRSFNTAVEDTFRTAVFSDQIRKMALKESLKGFGTDLQIFEALQINPARKQEWIARGIAELNRTLGDYTNLTPVERNLFRRFILPFYPFYKHSAKFLLRLPIDHPFKATALLALGKLDAEMMGDFPEYLRGTVGMGWWGGQQLLMRFRGMNPLTAVGDTQGFSGLNPVLQQILSYAYGINTYTGEPLTSGDVINDFSGNKIQVIRDDNGNIIGMKPLPDGYKVTPTAYRILQTMVPQVNVIGGLMAGLKGEDIGARYSGTGGLIMDPETGEPKYPQPWWKDPVSFLGAPLNTVDPYELAVDQRAKEEALVNAWNNRGDI